MNFIRRTFPAHISKDVPVNFEIEMLFFVDLNKDLITKDKIILFDLDQETSVPIRFKYNNRTLKVKSINELNKNTHYQVQIIGGDKGILSITGAKMPETYSFEFYTAKEEAIFPPVIIKPTHLSETEESFSIEWTPVLGASYYEIQVSKSNTFRNLEWPSNDIPIYDTKIKPSFSYKKGNYYIRIRSVLENNTKSHYSDPIQVYYNGISKSREDNIKGESPEEYHIELVSKFVENESQLSSLQSHFIEQNKEEDQGLSLISSEPKHSSFNLSNSRNEIKLKFNKKLDEKSIKKDTIYVVKEKN